MTITSTLRQFWAGVCKVTGQLDLIREALENHDPQSWRAHSNANAEECLSLRAKLRDAVELRRQAEGNALYAEHRLAAEREKHEAESKRKNQALANLQSQLEGYESCIDQLNSHKKRTVELEELLSAEREAHEETYRELASARADLDALTQLKDARIEPPPEHAAFDIFSGTWRHTPESLAAWKAREGAGDD